MTPALATLGIGFILGYLGQRSRMCFVGAIRDYILIRDTYLLRGLIGFGVTAWLGFSFFQLIGALRPAPLAAPDLLTIAFTFVGGFGVGYISTLANGCPFRQHVLAAQGVISAITYLLGFLVGAVVFHTLVVPLLTQLLP